MIASFTMQALIGAGLLAVIGYQIWGWLGAILGLVLGYGGGIYFNARFAGVPVSPHLKGWASLFLFLAGLTLLAIVTR
jgi:hypothetical protein